MSDLEKALATVRANLCAMEAAKAEKKVKAPADVKLEKPVKTRQSSRTSRKSAET